MNTTLSTQPRAIKCLTKVEKQTLRAQLKTYNATTPERQAQLLNHPRWAVTQLVKDLEQRGFRELAHRPDCPHGAECVADTLFWARVNRAFLASVAQQPGPTSPAPNLTALEFCATGAVAKYGCPAILKANGRYLITSTHPDTNAVTRWTLAGRDGFDTLRDLTKHAADAGLRVYPNPDAPKGEPAYLLCVNEKGNQMKNEAKRRPANDPSRGSFAYDTIDNPQTREEYEARQAAPNPALAEKPVQYTGRDTRQEPEFMAQWPHTTAPGVLACKEDEAGIDLFDDAGPGRIAIYVRGRDGLRWPARTVTRGTDYFQPVLDAWALRGTVNDYTTPETAPTNPVFLTHNGVAVYQVYQHEREPLTLNYWFTLNPDGSNAFEVHDLPGYTEPDADAPNFRAAQQAEARRVIQEGIAFGTLPGLAPTSPAPSIIEMEGSQGRMVALLPTPFWYTSSGSRHVPHLSYPTLPEALQAAEQALADNPEQHEHSMVVVEAYREFEWQSVPNKRVVWEDGEWREDCAPTSPPPFAVVFDYKGAATAYQYVHDEAAAALLADELTTSGFKQARVTDTATFLAQAATPSQTGPGMWLDYKAPAADLPESQHRPDEEGINWPPTNPTRYTGPSPRKEVGRANGLRLFAQRYTDRMATTTVVAPNGTELAEFDDCSEAIAYARNNTDFGKKKLILY